MNLYPPRTTRPGIVRYPWGVRVNHWLNAIAFILLAATGLAFFHPAFFFLTHVLGGPQWARILHPWVGVFMFVCFLLLAIRMWSANRWGPNDTQWMKQLDDEIMNRDELLPPIDKYNPGQKLLFYVMVASLILLLLTGIVIWRSIFGVYFPVPVHRVAVLIHSFTAFVLIAGILVHIYAAIWVKGSFRSMFRGSVSHAWARHHHPGWYAQMTGRPIEDVRRDPVARDRPIV